MYVCLCLCSASKMGESSSQQIVGYHFMLDRRCVCVCLCFTVRIPNVYIRN